MAVAATMAATARSRGCSIRCSRCSAVVEAQTSELHTRKLQPLSTDVVYRLVWLFAKCARRGDASPPRRKRQRHRLTLCYRFRDGGSGGVASKLDEHKKAARERSDFRFETLLAFEPPQVEYEISSRVHAEKPSSGLCRASSPCDYVISLRSLTNTPETIVVALTADADHWSLGPRYKCELESAVRMSARGI